MVGLITHLNLFFLFFNSLYILRKMYIYLLLFHLTIIRLIFIIYSTNYRILNYIFNSQIIEAFHILLANEKVIKFFDRPNTRVQSHSPILKEMTKIFGKQTERFNILITLLSVDIMQLYLQDSKLFTQHKNIKIETIITYFIF